MRTIFSDLLDHKETERLGLAPSVWLSDLESKGINIDPLREELLRASQALETTHRAWQISERHLIEELRNTSIKKAAANGKFIPQDTPIFQLMSHQEFIRITQDTPLEELQANPEEWNVYGFCAMAHKAWIKADEELTVAVNAIETLHRENGFEEITFQEFVVPSGVQ